MKRGPDRPCLAIQEYTHSVEKNGLIWRKHTVPVQSDFWNGSWHGFCCNKQYPDLTKVFIKSIKNVANRIAVLVICCKFVGGKCVNLLNITEHLMAKKTKNILALNSDEALDFLMKSEQFHGFELPEYFDFDKVLGFVRKTVSDRPYDECIITNPSELQDVNFDILLNKDGKYAVRPLVLCNPYLYFFLAREITWGKNWQTIKECFKLFDVPHIKSCAIPVIPAKKEAFHKSTTILNWWNQMEQRSIELSLEYRYMFITDITNCYGSVNPQTIDWALSRRGTAHSTDDNHELARNIICFLRDLQQGRNIGIPQGSVLFDLTGEIILGYADLLFYEALQAKGVTGGFEVLRYRDDYRIFCNDKEQLEEMSFMLQHVLESLNFRMNGSKTRISDSLVTDSIKPDKLGYIYNTPIFNKKGCDFDGLQKHLLYILLFGRKYPDSGQVRIMLSDLDKRVQERLEPRKRTVTVLNLESDTNVFEEREEEVPGKILENIRAMSAICAQIAVENVNHAHYALRVASRMIESIKDVAQRRDILIKVCEKLSGLHNNSYYQLWLQNMTYRRDKQTGECPYDARLCRVVMGEDLPLWNNSWLVSELTAQFPQQSVVNQETLAKVTPIITFREARAYEEMEY